MDVSTRHRVCFHSSNNTVTSSTASNNVSIHTYWWIRLLAICVSMSTSMSYRWWCCDGSDVVLWRRWGRWRRIEEVMGWWVRWREEISKDPNLWIFTLVRRAHLGSSHDLFLWNGIWCTYTMWIFVKWYVMYIRCGIFGVNFVIELRKFWFGSESRENGVVPEDNTFLIPRY